MDVPVHPEDIRDTRELAPECLKCSLARHVEVDAQKERAGFGITELLRVQDVAAGFEQQAGHAMDDPDAIRA